MSLAIAHFSEVARPLMNGVILAVEQLMRMQRFMGHRVSLITPALGDVQPGWREEEQVLRIRSLPLPTSSGYRLAWPFGSMGAIRRHVGRVHLLHVHSLFMMGEIAQRIASSKRVPCVYTYHTNFDHYLHYAGLARGVTRSLLHERMHAFSHHLALMITPTGVIADTLRNMGVLAPIAVVPSGIDTAKFALPKRRRYLRDLLGIPDEESLLLCVARLAREKNLEPLLTMLKYLDESMHLVLLGNGPLRTELHARVRRMRLERRVHFLGDIAQEEIATYYAAVDLFIFPSVSETQGLVLCEALASGLPIVAVDTPVHRELIGESDATLVPNDAHALAIAVQMMLKREAWSLERAVKRKLFAQRFDAQRSAEQTDRLYREVLAKKSWYHAAQ